MQQKIISILVSLLLTALPMVETQARTLHLGDFSPYIFYNCGEQDWTRGQELNNECYGRTLVSTNQAKNEYFVGSYHTRTDINVDTDTLARGQEFTIDVSFSGTVQSNAEGDTGSQALALRNPYSNQVIIPVEGWHSCYIANGTGSPPPVQAIPCPPATYLHNVPPEEPANLGFGGYSFLHHFPSLWRDSNGDGSFDQLLSEVLTCDQPHNQQFRCIVGDLADGSPIPEGPVEVRVYSTFNPSSARVGPDEPFYRIPDVARVISMISVARKTLPYGIAAATPTATATSDPDSIPTPTPTETPTPSPSDSPDSPQENFPPNISVPQNDYTVVQGDLLSIPVTAFDVDSAEVTLEAMNLYDFPGATFGP